MSRFRTYSDFESAVARKIGESNLDNQLGTWINIAFNEKFREAMCAAQWPDVVLWEQRNPDGNGLLSYTPGTDPATGSALNDLEYIWGVYTTSPYTNLNIVPAKYLLNDQGAVLISPTTQVVTNGFNQQLIPLGPYWCQVLEFIPQYTGANYSALTGYTYGTVVYDTTTGDYYRNILVNAGQALTNTTWWTSTSIGNYNVGTTYASGTVVLDYSGGTGYYKSNVNSNVGNALSNRNYWTPITISPYASSFNYSANTVVWNQAAPTFYQSKTASNTNNALNNSTYWQTLTISAYSSLVSYTAGQVVFIPGAGTFYQAKQAATNVPVSNSLYWQQIAIGPYSTATTYDLYTNTSGYPNVVFDSSTATYYTCALDTVQQPLTATAYWKRLQIPSVLFNYIVHSVYAEYLLMAKQNDKHKVETEFANNILLTEIKRLAAQNQQPIVQVLTHLNQHYI